jgi:hypothetical protein
MQNHRTIGYSLRKKSDSITWVLEKITDEEVFEFCQWKYTRKVQKYCYKYIFFIFHFVLRKQQQITKF